MILREATVQDIDSIIAIYKDIIENGSIDKGYLDADLERVSNRVIQELNTFKVTELNGKVVGFIRLLKSMNEERLSYLGKYKDYTYLAGLFVSPASYRQGVAKFMLKELSNRCNWVSLVNVGPILNLASLNVHINCGYHQIEGVVFKESSDSAVVAFTNTLKN